MGLTEILLSSHENEGTLSDLLCRFAEGTITHVVIAEKREWDDYSELDFNLGNDRDKANRFAQEEVIVYSLTDEQKRYITDRIHNEELDMFESAEDFTFSHGYFPEKGIVGGKR